VEIVLGTLDERQKLTPCSRIEPFLPAGTKLRGKATIGLRCADTPGWTAWLPVDIRIWGPALVANGNFTSGQALAEQDVRTEEIDLAREPGAITNMAQIADKTLTRQLNAGQLLRQDQFRIRPMVSQGDMVQVVYSGNGFSVSTEAQALGQASSGQTLRVKTNSGKVLSGVLQPGRIVAISF
jgi:flagella basal body P-ring formation protein FlgA